MIEKFEEKPIEFWKAVLGEVELKLSPMVFKSLVSRTTAEIDTDGNLKVLCEDDFVKNNVEKRYNGVLEEAAQKLANRKVLFKAVVKKAGLEEKAAVVADANLGPLFIQPKSPADTIREKQKKSNLSPKFTFESYIMGKNNNLAYAIATAVAQRPGELYNPVFVYSGVGLGKTHLIQAIGNEIIKNKPGMNVVYTTGEAFTNELIDAIKNGKGGPGKYSTNDFRNKFRKADVLLIDDIQFVIGKEATQEEFFHTFNALYMAQKQIVITSDRPPKDFNSFEERITSRFSSGIIADIQAPDMEVRAAILRTKRDALHHNISNEVLNFIAESVTTNIRELEGAYMQVVTHAMAEKIEPTRESAAYALGQSLKNNQKRNVSVNEILKAVCTYYAVKVPDIKGKRRTKDLVIPRQVAMFLMKEMTDTPYMTIGDFLGGRDHTTIMYGVRTIEGEVSKAGKIQQDIVNVRLTLAE
ncbi:MAG: Chromosomal replication initiator protein DnaA [candidate division WWE3 bacterium GW2011_GWB1_42_117]|nr:MAG: Chromosomal replication initiator protein DnaA [candidate division WWE3 bacterium GW2011_GWB1_42_117]